MPQERKTRATWTSEQLRSAMDDVKNKVLSQMQASKHYRIPKRTLKHHLESGKETKTLGRSSALTTAQEKAFSGRIVRLCKIGMLLTPTLVRRSAFKFCADNNIKHNFLDIKEVAGKD